MTARHIPRRARLRAGRAHDFLAGLLAGLIAAMSLSTLPRAAHACACGCGVFEVGTASMFPTRQGGTLSFEYDFMNQADNWSGTASAPASGNEDKQIRTHFTTLGARYMVNRAWGLGLEVPYWDRFFRTADESGQVEGFTHGAVGDVRVRGLYSGFSEDLSSGLSAGLKLPTGDHRYANFDRDTEIGSGSTDLLLGAYHVGPLTADRAWNWFAEGQLDRPFAYSGGYRPGSEVDATVALFHAGLRAGPVTVSPMLGLIASSRARDQGAEASPDDSGYARLLAAPGLDASFAGMRATVSADLQLAQHVNGNQLVAPALFKVELGHSF